MRRFLAPVVLVLLVVGLVGIFAADAAGSFGPKNPGYDGSTSILLNSQTPNWKVLTGVGTLRVREVDIRVIGAQAGAPGDDVRWPRMFGCWYAPDPNAPLDNRTSIGFVDFLPEPKVNSTEHVGSLVFPADLYGDGYAAPQPAESIFCGWDPKGYGYPDLVGGYGRAHIFYTDSGSSR